MNFIGLRIYAWFSSGRIVDWTHMGEEGARKWSEELPNMICFAADSKEMD